MKNREFGLRLTRYRERLQLTITQLAETLGVHYTLISRYEKGDSLPSLDTAVRLAQALQITLDELATGTSPAGPPPPVFENTRLLQRMRDLERLPSDRQDLALRVLDTVIAGHELETLGERLRRS